MLSDEKLIRKRLVPTASYLAYANEHLSFDIVYFNTPNDGTVFSTGSIGFGQALPAMNFENNISKLLGTVVDAFIKPGALPGSLVRHLVSRFFGD
jgi:hypothetical protein